MENERREFIKRVGLGSLGLAATPTFVQALTTPALGSHLFNWHFLALSSAGVVDGIHHTIAMVGDGSTNPLRGGGAFAHFNNDPELPLPKPMLATGRWRANDLVSLETIGTYGGFTSGVINLRARLLPAGGPSLPADLQIVCNLGFAGLVNFDGEGNPLAEGYTVTASGLTFTPFVPPLGLTVFTNVREPVG